MVIIPIEQTVSGAGNTVYKNKEVGIVKSSIKSIQFTYLNSDGSIYSGINYVDVNVFASNEKVLKKEDIKYLAELSAEVLTPNEPSFIINIPDRHYRNIIVQIESIRDGKVTALCYP